MLERLRSSDYRFLAICLALLAVTVWFSFRNFHQAFPEASIDFRVTRDGARDIAERFLAARSYKLAGYRQAARFSFDDEAKTFLEREAGLETANQVMGTQVRLWRWSNRWFRPQQKEEFRADVTPRGEVVAFQHQIPEAEARTSITPEQARALAEGFLRDVMHRDPASLEFVEASTAARPARADHVLTWKERAFNLKDSSNRVEVTLLGNEIGGYREYLKVPEQWARDYERLRSRNQAAQVADTAVMMLLIIGLLATLAIALRQHDVRWKRAAVVGIIGGALAFLSSWNEFPLTEFSYPTTDSYASFVARQAINSLLGALAAAGLLFLLTAAAEPIYRRSYPNQVSLGNLFRPEALGTRRFFLGTVLGIALTGIFVAYQTGFYMVAYRFGAWSPADVPYSDLLNTKFPWAQVLFGGFLPAVSEEFLFRMFAIPFLRKLVRSTWVAVVLAGFIWGFGHAGYPQQPFWIRGVEVGIGGVALGLVVLRWGILPTLVWHYSVDALYTAMLLLRSDSPYFKLSGALSAGIMVLPVVIALAAYLRRGGFAPDDALTNAADVSEDGGEGVPQPVAVEPAPVATPALTSATWGSGRRVAALAVFLAGMASMSMPLSTLGERPKYRLGQPQVVAAADAFVRSRQAKPESFRHIAFPASRWEGEDALAGKYFLERRDVPWVDQLFRRDRPLQAWLVRYFRPLDKEEFLVAIHPETGALAGFRHSLAEDQVGADLTPQAAQQLAAGFAATQGRDLSTMELKESTSEKRKARRDYTLVWEARPGDARNLDEARFRLHLQVAGDQVTELRTGWKIPETFSRARAEQNALSITVTVAKIMVYSVPVVFGLVALVMALRKGEVRWRGALRVAVPLTLLAVVSSALNINQMWRAYNTVMPAGTFQAIMGMGMMVTLVFAFLMFAAMAAFLQVTTPDGLSALTAAARRAWGLDAVMAALAAIGLVALAAQFRTLLLVRFHAQALFGVIAPELLAGAAPAVSALASAARSVITYCAAVALGVYLLKHLRERWWAIPIALAGLAAAVPASARTPGEFALHYAAALVWLLAAAAFCFGFARGNPLAYALAAWALALRGNIAELLQQPNAWLHLQGGILAAVLAVSLVWAALPALRRSGALPPA